LAIKKAKEEEEEKREEKKRKTILKYMILLHKVRCKKKWEFHDIKKRLTKY